eukprot:4895847-Ditylum_brightwellii.AAC.1
MHPPVYEVGDNVYFKTPTMSQYEYGVVLVPPSEQQPYTTIRNKTTGDITQMDPTEITTLNPQS